MDCRVKLTKANVGDAADFIIAKIKERFPTMHPNAPLQGAELHITPEAWGGIIIGGKVSHGIIIDGKVSPKAAALRATYGDALFEFRIRKGFAVFSRGITYIDEIAPVVEELIKIYRCELICSLSRP